MARRYIGILPIGGMIALCAILLLAPEARSEITITPRTYTISGKIGVAGVSLSGLPPVTPGGPPPMTDDNGVYSAVVPYGWSGKVTPVKNGYTFTPNEKVYPKITSDQSSEDYTPTVVTYTISGAVMNGSVGEPGVKMNGLPNEVMTDQNGRYTATVDWGMTYNVVPDKMGYRFDPPNFTFNQVKRDFTQNFKATEVTFTISGSVGEPGVKMNGFANPVVSDQNGNYSGEVRYGFTGTITPKKDGCIFTPESHPYEMVTAPQSDQNFSVEVLKYTIAGSAGQPDVLMKGFPDQVTTDAMGYYQATVPWGWDGTVTPVKAGWEFKPPSNVYKDVVANVDNQNYNGERIYLTIEGKTGIGQVTLSGFPGGDITSNETGMYSVKVEYGWAGQVIPTKEGYTFTPSDQTFSPVTQNLTGQDFKADRMTFEISGSVQPPLAGVLLKSKDLPRAVVVGADGSYKFSVDYGWSGTVTPEKSGYTFEPAEYSYSNVQFPQPNQNFFASIITHPISGSVTEKDGTPVPDIVIVAEGTTPVDSVTTDATGAFSLKVPHGWSGKITPQGEAYLFSPPTKIFSAVGGPMSNLTILAERKMLTITDVMKYGSDPIVGVEVTANPGNYQAKTDATGTFHVKVPYGWTGELSFFKPEFDISGTKAYTNVTADIDETKPTPPPAQPKPTQPKPTQPAPTQPAPTQPTPTQPTPTQPAPTQPAPTQPTPTQPGPSKPVMAAEDIPTTKELLQQRLEKIKAEIDALPVGDPKMLQLMSTYQQVRAMLEGTVPVNPNLLGQGAQTVVNPDGGPLVPNPATPKLLSVLKELSKLTNVPIGVDLTVKDEPVQMGAASVQGLPIELALQKILEGTSKTYTFERSPDGAILVYLPISNTFVGGDIRQALMDVAMEAEVPIIPDPNVVGTTAASFENKPLEGALSMILAGTGYVSKRMPDNYYLVADRSPEAPSFPDITATEYIRTNHMLPQKIKGLLPVQYQQYVQAEATSTTDANDLGHLITITAPKRISDIIRDMVRNLDKDRRQVLLDARVVAMERSNMVNLGIEWSFPTLQAGLFSDGSVTSKGLQIGYSPDQGFTNALMATLNLLEATNQADIVANPQLTAQDGSQAQLRSIQEEWFMMTDPMAASSQFGYYSRAELQKIESGTVLTITPYIGDSNQITLKMAVEVSDSIPRGPDSDLPIVTRRQTKNTVTIQNGGTVAVAGLTESRNRNVEKRVPLLGSLPLIGAAFRNNDDQKVTREIAVFVTATLVEGDSLLATKGRAPTAAAAAGVGSSSGIRSQPQPREMTQDDIAAALRRTR